MVAGRRMSKVNTGPATWFQGNTMCRWDRVFDLWDTSGAALKGAMWAIRGCSIRTLANWKGPRK